jgi:hypothetical protein
MAVRCKVTFFDLKLHMRRSVLVTAPSPTLAAEIALARMLARDFFVTDFGDSVRVEILTSMEQSLRLGAIAQAIGADREQTQAA